MAEVVACSQFSLFLMPKHQLKSSTLGLNSCSQFRVPPVGAFPAPVLGKKSIFSPTLYMQAKQFSWVLKASIATDFKVPTTYVVDATVEVEQVDILPDTGGSGGDLRGDSGSGGGGGGDDSGGNDGKNEGGGASDESKDHDAGGSKKKTAMSMSQKLTLGYAVLVGVGGIMGYLKSGSQKSLISGGLSASLLYYVYTLLPSKPVLASSLGLGLSASLLGVMGSRFLKSGKIFPAGIVSLVSLIMSGGYLHGVMRSLH